MRDLYSVLNLSRRASSKDIKAAYWTLAKQFHPDLNAGDKAAEGWTKEINRAYEILGNPDARTAYDLEMARQRTKARRSFLSGAAAGAATIVLAASISIGLLWKQHALRTESAKNDMLVSNAPARQHDTPRSTVSEHPELAADPAVPATTAPLPRLLTELPASTSSDIASTAPTEMVAPTPDAPAPSSVVTAHAAKEGRPGAAPSEPSKTEMPEGQPVPQAPDRQPSPRTELAIVASPEIEAKKPASPATVDQEPSSKPLPRDGNRKAEVVGSVHKKANKHLNVPRVAGATPTKLQGSEREPRLVSSRATALRWPSADEPFVNLGVRNR
jgi:hypothetical protein